MNMEKFHKNMDKILKYDAIIVKLIHKNQAILKYLNTMKIGNHPCKQSHCVNIVEDEGKTRCESCLKRNRDNMNKYRNSNEKAKEKARIYANKKYHDEKDN